MLKVIKKIAMLSLGFAAFSLAMGSLAQERGTKEEALAMMEASIAHIKAVGMDQAAKDFMDLQNTKWHQKDLYISVLDLDTEKKKVVIVAHGTNSKLVGRDFGDVKDADGNAFLQDIFKGDPTKGVELNYKWQDPLTKKIAPKTSFVKSVGGPKYANQAILIGIYK